MRRGDRVVVRTKGGEVMAKVLQRQTSETFELASFNPDHEPVAIATDDVEWIARIIWASQ
jgi:phage repressor protein C with HTH and peptisase S24 domain